MRDCNTGSLIIIIFPISATLGLLNAIDIANKQAIGTPFFAISAIEISKSEMQEILAEKKG